MAKDFLHLPFQGSFDSLDTIKEGSIDNFYKKEGGLFVGQSAGEILDELITDYDLPEFHIGQSYEDKPAQAIRCAICGGNQFNIGRGSYFTAIRCVHCEWEICLHEG